jgi:WhiB family transcriptional regulator, redox-sensing transcriptional regulator
VTARKNGIPTLAEAVDLSPETLFAPAEADWRSKSLCSELPLEEADRLFYPRRGDSTKAARALCARCPVSRECLEFALEDEHALRWGVWGGTSPQERRALFLVYVWLGGAAGRTFQEDSAKERGVSPHGQFAKVTDRPRRPLSRTPRDGRARDRRHLERERRQGRQRPSRHTEAHRHAADGRLKHRVSTYRRFRSRALASPGLILLDFWAEGEERLAWVSWNNGRLRAQITDDHGHLIAWRRVTRPNRRSVVVWLRPSDLGDPPSYRWQAMTQWHSRTGVCSEAVTNEGCWDHAPNRRFLRHTLEA